MAYRRFGLSFSSRAALGGLALVQDQGVGVGVEVIQRPDVRTCHQPAISKREERADGTTANNALERPLYRAQVRR